MGMPDQMVYKKMKSFTNAYTLAAKSDQYWILKHEEQKNVF